MVFFKCRQLFIKNAKIWRLFTLRNKNKNKSRNLALKSGNADDHSDRFNSADVDVEEADNLANNYFFNTRSVLKYNTDIKAFHPRTLKVKA